MKGKGGRKTVIRSWKWANCKWVDDILTAEQPDTWWNFHPSPYCVIALINGEWEIYFFPHFPWDRWARDKWKSRETPSPESLLLSFCHSYTHTPTVRRPTFPFFEGLLFSCAARWGLIPAIPQLILVRIQIAGKLRSFSYFPSLLPFSLRHLPSFNLTRSLFSGPGAEKAWPLRFLPSLRLVLNTQQIKAQAWKLTLAIYLKIPLADNPCICQNQTGE